MSSLHFLRPYFLLLIIPFLGLMILFIKQRSSIDAWQRVVDTHLLPHLLLDSNQQQRFYPLLLLGIGGLLAILALSGPSFSKQIQPVFRSNNALVIAFELSPSLYASDLKPNRLTRAKYKIQDILKRQREGQVGLVAFSSHAFVVSPLTQDTATIAAMIPVLDPNIMPVTGSNIANGLTAAAQLIQQGSMHDGRILLITDKQPTAHDYAVAKQFKQQGIDTSVLGVGTSQGAPIPAKHGFAQNNNGTLKLSHLNSAALKQLSAAGGGRYASFSNTDADLNYLLQTPTAHTLSVKKSQQAVSLWQDQGYWLVLLMLPLAALAFRRGWFERLIEQ